MKQKLSGGYTLIETIVILALISLLIITIIVGSGQGAKIERYSAETRAFANLIREAQTKAYSVETSNSPECLNAGGYARGTLLQYTRGTGSYTLSLICGSDLSPVSGASTSQTDGLRGTAASRRYELNGLELNTIDVGTSAADNVSIAFLAPDGKAYQCVTNAANDCEPSSSNPTPFGGRSSSNQQNVIFHFTYPGIDVARRVTFETISGKIAITDE